MDTFVFYTNIIYFLEFYNLYISLKQFMKHYKNGVHINIIFLDFRFSLKKHLTKKEKLLSVLRILNYKYCSVPSYLIFNIETIHNTVIITGI